MRKHLLLWLHLCGVAGAGGRSAGLSKQRMLPAYMACLVWIIPVDTFKLILLAGDWRGSFLCPDEL